MEVSEQYLGVSFLFTLWVLGLEPRPLRLALQKFSLLSHLASPIKSIFLLTYSSWTLYLISLLGLLIVSQASVSLSFCWGGELMSVWAQTHLVFSRVGKLCFTFFFSPWSLSQVRARESLGPPLVFPKPLGGFVEFRNVWELFGTSVHPHYSAFSFLSFRLHTCLP